MTRTVDWLIEDIWARGDLSIVEKQIIVNRLESAPSREEIEAAKVALKIKGMY